MANTPAEGKFVNETRMEFQKGADQVEVVRIDGYRLDCSVKGHEREKKSIIPLNNLIFCCCYFRFREFLH